MKGNKKVLYLGGFELPDKNAAAQRVLSNAKLLREMGFHVTFVGISKDIDNAPKNVDGFSSFPIPYPKNVIQWLRQITTYVSSEKLLDYQPDYVILYNFPAIASLNILRHCHKHGIKVIHDLTEWEQTGGFSPRDIIKRLDTQLRMRFCMKKMDGVIAISRYLYNYYKESVKTVLVPPTVDLSSPKWNRSRLLSSNKPIKLVYAGSPGAGVKDRLDIIINRVKKQKGLVLNVIGLTENQYFESFHQQPVHYNNIRFMGRLPHEEALREVCEADFQVIIREQSLKNNAGFPTKFVESMACGIPVIATVFSNITDYLKNGECGFIVNEFRPLNVVLEEIVKLNNSEIIRMKQDCLNIQIFDYRYYKEELYKLFD